MLEVKACSCEGVTEFALSEVLNIYLILSETSFCSHFAKRLAYDKNVHATSLCLIDLLTQYSFDYCAYVLIFVLNGLLSFVLYSLHI